MIQRIYLVIGNYDMFSDDNRLEIIDVYADRNVAMRKSLELNNKTVRRDTAFFVKEMEVK